MKAEEEWTRPQRPSRSEALLAERPQVQMSWGGGRAGACRDFRKVSVTDLTRKGNNGVEGGQEILLGFKKSRGVWSFVKDYFQDSN